MIAHGHQSQRDLAPPRGSAPLGAAFNGIAWLDSIRFYAAAAGLSVASIAWGND